MLRSALLRFAQQPDNERFANDFWQALNAAQYDIATSRPWGFLRTSTTLTCTADTRTIALPSDFDKPVKDKGAIVITTTSYSGDVIDLMTEAQWHNEEYEDGTDTGEPAYAYIQGSSLYLSPIPDAAYTIHFPYFKLPSEIDNTNGTITVPTKYHELLEKMIYRRLQDSGYSDVNELQISDNDIRVLFNKAARNDIEEYGGLTFNLNTDTYERRTT
ncbi:MAG: hypothetical protein PHW65_00050 [Dehalococcoidales bacterium]|nr:hypothetical protein [Dehalococcoidales bacterium]